MSLSSSFSVHYSLVSQMVKNLPAMREAWVRSLGWEDPLEEEMATHSSILAWRIPWTEEPGGLQSMGSQSDTTQRPSTSTHRSKKFCLQNVNLVCKSLADPLNQIMQTGWVFNTRPHQSEIIVLNAVNIHSIPLP